MILSERYS